MSEVAITPIPLTQGRIAWIDTDDLPAISRHLWFAVKCSGQWYAARTDGDGRRQFMHRTLLLADMVDHEDGDGLNNTRTNLRECTSSQNAANRRILKSSTGLRGVFKARGGFVARVGAAGDRIYLGHFTSANHAFANAAAAAARLHGAFSGYGEVRAANDER